MSVQTIPTFSDPFWTQVTNLDGVDYTLTFTYNQREDVFYMTIGDAVGNDIFRGLKLVCNWPLLAGRRDARLPKGTLIVCSNTPEDGPPGLTELASGARCELCYFPLGG